MAFLLDTNVVSELRKADRTHPKVISWQANYPAAQQWISVISLMEMRIGIVRAKDRDPEFARVLDIWYQQRLLPAYARRIIPVGLKIAEKRADYEKRRTISYSDALIGATAATNHLSLVTRNTKDFVDLGIDLINPWEHSLN